MMEDVPVWLQTVLCATFIFTTVALGVLVLVAAWEILMDNRR